MWQASGLTEWNGGGIELEQLFRHSAFSGHPIESEGAERNVRRRECARSAQALVFSLVLCQVLCLQVGHSLFRMNRRTHLSEGFA